MPRRRLTLLLTMAAVACGRADTTKAASVSGASGVMADSVAVGVSGEWPSDLGTMLVIPSDTENLAVVLYPAITAVTLDPKAQLSLLAPGGDAVRLKAGLSGADSAHCGDAPMIRLARSTPLLWSVGITNAKANPVRSARKSCLV